MKDNLLFVLGYLGRLVLEADEFIVSKNCLAIIIFEFVLFYSFIIEISLSASFERTDEEFGLALLSTVDVMPPDINFS